MSDPREEFVASTKLAARRLISEGRIPLPVPRGEKATRLPDWSNPDLKPTEDDFIGDVNLAERLDTITDVDCDCDEARALAPDLLLNTGRVHGRPSLGPSHYWYDAPGSKYEVFKYFDKKPIVEIRTDSGHYTLLPPSVVMTKGDKPTPEMLTWHRDGAPGKVNAAGLRQSVCLLATAALLCRHWPAGGRHNTTLAISGMLANLDIHPKSVEILLQQLTKYTEGEEWSEIPATVSATYAAKKAGTPFTGAPELAKLISEGDAVVKLIRFWFRQSAPDVEVIDELNKRWFLVPVGTSPVVGEEVTQEHDGRTWTTFAFWEFTDFKKHLIKAKPVKVGENGKGDPIWKPLADYWLSHQHGRQYERFVYAPPGSGVKVGPRDLDGWKGFTVDPRPGDWSRNRAHIRDVICAGNEKLFEWVLDWCAALVREPGRHAETALVLVGGQGTGKGHFADVMIGQSFDGRHYAMLSNQRRVLGEFNDALSGLCVLFFDEASFSKTELVAAAKTLITGHVQYINRKGLPIEAERSMLHVIYASNDLHPMPLDPDDRRNCVLHLSRDRAGDIQYFKALCAELENGGRAAMLHELSNRPYSWDNLRIAPDTKAKQATKRKGWTPVQVFLARMIESTRRGVWATGKNIGGCRRISKEETAQQYLEYLRSANVKSEVLDARAEIHDAIREHTAAGFNFNKPVKTESVVTRDFWTLPSYDEFRNSFARARGIDASDLSDPDAGDDSLPFAQLSAPRAIQERINAAATDVVALSEIPSSDLVPEVGLIGRREDGRPVYVLRFVDPEVTEVTQG